MKKNDIHSVCNQTQNNGTAISLHVYGQDLRTTGRSKFDTINMTESPYEMTFVPLVWPFVPTPFVELFETDAKHPTQGERILFHVRGTIHSIT